MTSEKLAAVGNPLPFAPNRATRRALTAECRKMGHLMKPGYGDGCLRCGPPWLRS